MTLEELIKIRQDRLIDVPEAFVSGVKASQNAFYENILSQLSAMQVDSNGLFVSSESNYSLALNIKNNLQQSLFDTTYTDSLLKFSKQFNEQAQLNNDFFEKLVGGTFEEKDIYKSAFQNSKRNAIQSLSEIPQSLEVEFSGILDSALTTNQSFTQTIQSVRTMILGNEEIDGAMVKYSKQIAYDGYATTHRTYMQSITTDLGFEFYKYSGREIKNTRCFCDTRAGNVYHMKEIEGWGKGKGVGECGFPWAGMRKGTNESTIFTFVGGYNCQHDLLPLTIKQVPESALNRAIEKGYYKPKK